MLNHFRTLLVNAPGPPPSAGPRDASGGPPGSEAVPPGFAPVPLPPHLAAVRARLFGADPDAAMLAFRARQLLACVHATELDAYARALDPRLSYDPAGYDPAFLAPGLFAPRVTPAGPSFQGDPAAPDAAGRCSYGFRVEADGAGGVTVSPLDGRSPQAYSEPGYAGGVSGPVRLGDTGYSARLPAGPGVWLVAGLLRPAWGLPELAASLADAAPQLDEAFGARAEPYLTFRNLWESHTELAYRLGGAVCALVYRTEEERARARG